MTTDIKTFRVSWCIDVEAGSPEQAAQMVARDYLQAGHTATVLDVAPFDHVSDNFGIPGDPVEVDAGTLPVWRPDNALDLIGQDLEEYCMTSDGERAEVLNHIAHNLAAVLPPAMVKAAIDCALADAIVCVAPSSSQAKADMLRQMLGDA